MSGSKKEIAGNSLELPALCLLILPVSLLRCHCSVIYTNIINQAGEEGAGFQILAGTQI
jgi:hypothetical protein